MKKSHKLFFAIPFDTATIILYERVRARIKELYPNVETVIGNNVIGPSPTYSDIVSFKLQNRQLTEQFETQIQEADIVIADLTHNNPNVHFELGIALMQNKNILRVSGRSLSELGFDIRNLEVSPYKDEEQLNNRIINYLKTFFRIKGLTISSEHNELYFKESQMLKLRGYDPSGQKPFHMLSNSPPTFVMRDGGVKVKFEILVAMSPADWFGVYLRTGDIPFNGSYLVYARQSGELEIAQYPGRPKVLKQIYTGGSITGTHELTVQFENNYLEAQIDNLSPLIINKLSFQKAGRVLPAALNTNVDVHSFEMVCRDTIAWE